MSKQNKPLSKEEEFISKIDEVLARSMKRLSGTKIKYLEPTREERQTLELERKSIMNIQDTIVITLPLPPRILSPNCPIGSFRGRMMRAAAAKKQKRIAKEAAEDAMRGERWNRASVRAVFYHKTKRRRDDVNALAMLKSAYDGIVLAGLIPDDDRDHLRTEGAEFAIDKDWPRVELIFTKEE